MWEKLWCTCQVGLLQLHQSLGLGPLSSWDIILKVNTAPFFIDLQLNNRGLRMHLQFYWEKCNIACGINLHNRMNVPVGTVTCIISIKYYSTNRCHQVSPVIVGLFGTTGTNCATVPLFRLHLEKHTHEICTTYCCYCTISVCNEYPQKLQ